MADETRNPGFQETAEDRFWLDRPERTSIVSAMKTVWQIQEAKNQFSRVVENALTHGVQTITKHGKPAVVIVAAETYRKSQPRRRIVDALQACPAPGLELHRHNDAPRSIDL